MTSWIWTLVLLIVITCGQTRSEEETISKHNYGYLWKRKQQVRVMVKNSKLVFHYTLPSIPDIPVNETVNCSALTSSNRVGCGRMRSLITGFLNARRMSVEYLHRQLGYIYEQIYDVPTRDRVERGFWTSALSDITGLATKSDLQRVREQLMTIERGITVAADTWRSGTASFVAVMQVEKNRVDHIMQLVEFQRISVLALKRELVTAMRTADGAFKILRRCVDMQRSVMNQMSELEALRTAMDHLTAGRLEHFVVNHTQLTGALSRLNSYLVHVHPELRIARMDTRYYYQESKVKIFRVGRQIAIVVNIPLTLKTAGLPLTVYKLTTIPLASPTSKKDFTMLVTDIKAIAYSRDADYFVEFTEAHQIPTGSMLNLEETGLVLQQRDTSISCGLMLMQGSLRDIKQRCRYQILRTPLTPNVYKLTTNKYLLSNITKASVTCNETVHGDSDEKEIFLPQTQNIVHLDCGCSLKADWFLVVDSAFDCRQNLDLNTTGQAYFILNLPYISEFLDDTFLHVMPGDLFLNTSIPVILPTLAVASKTYESMLAQTEEDSFEMGRAINATKRQVRVFGNLAHYLYNILLESHQENETFDVFNALDWCLIVAMFLSVAALFLALRMSWKLRALTLVLTAAGRGHAAGIPTRLQLTPATGQATDSPGVAWKYHEHVTDVLPVDISILICLLLAFLVIVYRGYRKYRKPEKIRTKLILELGSPAGTSSWIIAELPYGPAQYRFTVSKGALDARFEGAMAGY